MVFFNQKEILTNQIINDWSQEAAKQYTLAAGKRAASKKKIQIAIEELLISFKDIYGTETPCQLVGKKFLGRILFEFRQEGEQKDIAAPEDGMQYSYDILANLGINPKYNYSSRHHRNCVELEAELKPRKNKMMFQILEAIIFAVILYFSLHAISAGAVSYIYEGLTKPLFDKLCAIIAALATPLVFLCVITGITGLGDAASFGKIGKRVCGNMGITYLVAGTILGILSSFVYPISQNANLEQASVLSQIVQLVLDIIPNNLLEPFVIDNDLQVISIAIFIGFVFLLIGSKLKNLAVIINEASNLVNKMMALVCKTLPIIVFLGIFNIICASDVKEILSVYKMVLVFIASSAMVLAITIFRVKRATEVPFRIIFKKMLPTLMINLSTSSQVAALPENMHCCKDKFGIDGKTIDFALPLGIVVYMPCGAIFLALVLFSLAALSGTALSLAAFIKGIIIAIILAIAAPPIPGSAFAVMPILFTACGIPQDLYSIAIVLGTIIGYFLPAFNGFLLQLEMILAGKKLDLIDMNKLKDPSIE